MKAVVRNSTSSQSMHEKKDALNSRLNFRHAHHEKQSQNQSEREEHLTQHTGLVNSNTNTNASNASVYRRSYAQIAVFDRASNEQKHNRLYRYATRPGPVAVPEIVHEVLRKPGSSIPAEIRRKLEVQLDQNFADVRIHTDEHAGKSAQAVAAQAYTVGRHIVFAPGQFNVGSTQGRQLLLHEMAHAAAYPSVRRTPADNLRISHPNEASERNATAVSKGLTASDVMSPESPRLFRTPGNPVSITGVSVNHSRVTVPPIANLSFSARVSPANAQGSTFSIVGDNATIAAGTSINSSTGVIAVDNAQQGGSAHVEATQTVTNPDGSTNTTTATAPFNFTATPTGISSTSKSVTSTANRYGGDFTHTFSSPGGGQAALERAHVNERFAAAAGTTLNLTGPLGNFSITVNNPNAATSGWDLDNAGVMVAPDHVTWSNSTDARSFVANASNPNPTNALPQELTATQEFRNLSFPNQVYGNAVATTTHRRAFEERQNRIKAVTSANAAGINQEVVQDYVGPTIFRRASANPASIPVAPSAPPGGTAPAATTSTITVDREGRAANPTFSVRPPNLGCSITASGVLTPGTTAGTVTVRAGSSTNYDETTVTIAAPSATGAGGQGSQSEGQVPVVETESTEAQ